jgi:MoaA/NifB/PqqE/SkfB family radical SAM enzyme
MPIQNIPINKGNYSLETPERERLFEKYLSQGWEEAYQDYRKKWIEYAENKQLAEYPLLVDLELSAICNLQCPMCYTITDDFKKRVKARLMDFNLFKKIIAEIGGKVPAIRLSLRGEPTLHPNFLDCIRYAKTKGIQEVSTLTNCSKLSGDYFQEAMEAGLDWLTISVDGLNEQYESIRRPLKFKDTLQKIKDFKAIKDHTGSKKPVIKVQTVWPAIKDNPEEFYNTFAPLVDFVAFNPLIDYLSKDENIIYEEYFSCPQLYQRLVIGADGLVMICSNDEDGSVIAGDANKETIYAIWRGERLNKIREIHKQKDGFLSMPVCKKCYLPRLTEDSEISKINGRELIIKNYVNRKQVIGE